MSKLDEHIELARRHVREGRLIVAAHHRRMATGKVDGEDARQLLATFERTLETFERDLNRLLKERDEK